MTEFFCVGELVVLGTLFAEKEVFLFRDPSAFSEVLGISFLKDQIGLVLDVFKSNTLWVRILCPSGVGWVMSPYLERATKNLDN